MNSLQYCLEKLKASQPGFDADLHYERLTSYPEGVWFQPNNRDQEDYSICRCLFDQNLIEMKVKPIWSSGTLRGAAVSFRYKLDLDYITDNKTV